jgi:branched-chain amino acid transport system ATP-binding protein
MLEVRGLTTAYGGIVALRDVSLNVAEGQMVALIGPNGAGKTTLLNSISGILRARSGDAAFDGRSLAGVPAHEVARRGVLQVPEGRRILGPLSVEENLQLGRLALGTRGAGETGDLERVYALFPILEEKREQPGESLSGGQQQMLAIGRALMGKPRVLLLDEPSLGLAPLVVQLVFDALVQLNREGLTILLVEQNARRALAASQYAYVLEQGRIVDEGVSERLASDPKIIAHYLGTDSKRGPHSLPGAAART